MNTKVVSITAALIFIGLVIACKKNSAGPKISFKFKSLNATTFSAGQLVDFRFEFTPKTVKNDTLFVTRHFYTCTGFIPDTLKQAFPPDYDNSNTGELQFAFQYNSGGFKNGCRVGSSPKTDSLNYRFWIKDGNGNVSDTIVSPKIILLKP